jgi:hypothetical protein
VVDSKDFPGLVPQVSFSFDLDVSCKVTEIRSLSEIPDITFEIDPSSTEAKTFLLPVYNAFPCAGSVSYQRQLKLDSFTDFLLNSHQLDPNLSSPLPDFLTYSDSDGIFSISIADP